MSGLCSWTSVQPLILYDPPRLSSHHDATAAGTPPHLRLYYGLPDQQEATGAAWQLPELYKVVSSSHSCTLCTPLHLQTPFH